ncbi:hypothetical protein BT63DRAFT_120416 [Microthyrium microscopicum]|uniref:Autophagy-related protein 28 n=1 Tax=Microthyrium microscopicum TaxID=703497 RepID=A0A6A6TTV2_9PEZI|nr:hypothetical protein BT63DRAFT_120416 [Microthyrium microscopicum]
MSLFNAILPARVRLAASQHELPVYNSPPLSPSAFPPPPVAASIYSSSPAQPASSITARLKLPIPRSEDMIALSRREKQLEGMLQELLDAQSDALMAGVSTHAPPSEDDVMSINSGTPRLQSPVRSPDRAITRNKPLTPAAARRGIYKAVRKLASVKEHEEVAMKDELHKCQGVKKRLDTWEKKRTGLRNEITTINREDIEVRKTALRGEADKLQDEITETQQKLNRMRRRHHALIDEIAQIDNQVQSKLTSYVTSLNMLEQDIAKYLENPAEGRPHPHAGEPDNFLALPASRRTLEMAQDYWMSQSSSLSTEAKEARREKRALDSGSALWKACYSRIEAFERHLAREMRTLSPDNSTSSMVELLRKMSDVISEIEADMELATSKNWRLLVACIGAELEAFRQGREMLEQAWGIAKEQDIDTGADLIEHEESLPGDLEDEEEEDGPQTVWNTPRASKILSQLDDDDESGDDEPDPELLVSRQRTNSTSS